MSKFRKEKCRNLQGSTPVPHNDVTVNCNIHVCTAVCFAQYRAVQNYVTVGYRRTLVVCLVDTVITWYNTANAVGHLAKPTWTSGRLIE